MARDQGSAGRIRIQLSIDESNPAFAFLQPLTQNSHRRSTALSMMNTTAALLLAPAQGSGGVATGHLASLSALAGQLQKPDQAGAGGSTGSQVQPERATRTRSPRGSLGKHIDFKNLGG